ncbi:MAG: hypothetical protein WBM07_16235 [Chitinivibrionales bacterium]
MSIKQGQCNFVITIVPYNSFSLPSKGFVRRQNHFYYEKNGGFIIKFKGAFACVNNAEKKMTLGFRSASSEKTKTRALMAFVRLAVSMCAVLKGGLPFHSSAIAFGERGIAFSGPSGAGKSTIARLLVSPGQLLNDDFNIILPYRESAYKIYSTPYAERKTLKKCVNRGVDLRTIFFIEKSTTNTIENLPFKNKYISTLAQTFMFPLSDFFGKKILDNAERLCASVECKRLHFKNDETIRPFIYHHAGGQT